MPVSECSRASDGRLAPAPVGSVPCRNGIRRALTPQEAANQCALRLRGFNRGSGRIGGLQTESLVSGNAECHVQAAQHANARRQHTLFQTPLNLGVDANGIGNFPLAEPQPAAPLSHLWQMTTRRDSFVMAARNLVRRRAGVSVRRPQLSRQHDAGMGAANTYDSSVCMSIILAILPASPFMEVLY